MPQPIVNVLVVDDYPNMRLMLKNMLRQIGFRDVYMAEDGSSALVQLGERGFRLIISDWNMAPMTGFQLLKEVRADEKLKETKFILVTAESKTENVIAAKQAGVNNYIVKPFNAETLKTKLKAVIGEF